MGIGSGIAMIVFGLIFLLGVIQLDLAGVNEQALGLILVLGGIAIIVFQRGWWGANLGPRGTTRVIERRVVQEPPVQTRRVVEERPVVQQPPVVQEPPVTPQPRVVERRVVEREVDDPNVL